jgi:hypothetical protein
LREEIFNEDKTRFSALYCAAVVCLSFVSMIKQVQALTMSECATKFNAAKIAVKLDGQNGTSFV